MESNTQRPTVGAALKNAGRWLMSRGEIGTLIPLVALMILVGCVNPIFFSAANLLDILRTTSYLLIVAAPLTLLMITGDNDLTVGSVTALGGVVCGWGLTKLGLGIVPSILLAILAGALVGIIKSVLVINLHLPVFMIGLGLRYVVSGFINITTTGNNIVGFSDAFKQLGQGKMFGWFYYTIIIALALGILLHILLTRTKFGRNIYAVGGNRETARLAGINVAKTRYIVQILTSVFAALCGVLRASRFSSAQVGAGAGTEMTLMAAIIIGGTSFGGGTGGALGTLFGCILLAAIDNSLILMHVSSYWTEFTFGFILIVALIMDLIRKSKSGGGL